MIKAAQKCCFFYNMTKVNKIKEKTQAHDLIVIMGAGDIIKLSSS